MDWFKRLLDSADASVDLPLAGGTVLIVALIGFVIYDVGVLRHAFDASTFGTGAAALLGGVGAGAAGTGIQRKTQAQSVVINQLTAPGAQAAPAQQPTAKRDPFSGSAKAPDLDD